MFKYQESILSLIKPFSANSLPKHSIMPLLQGNLSQNFLHKFTIWRKFSSPMESSIDNFSNFSSFMDRFSYLEIRMGLLQLPKILRLSSSVKLQYAHHFEICLFLLLVPLYIFLKFFYLSTFLKTLNRFLILPIGYLDQ